jgi:hypothetical protein
VTIKSQKTYVLARTIEFYTELDFAGGTSPVCRGVSVRLPMGCKVCVAHFGSSAKCACMTTPVRTIGPVFGWVDATDLVELERADAEGLSPCFV